MKKILILLIVVCLPYFGYTKWIRGDAATVSFDAEQTIITKGDNTFIATEASDYTAELRVYGIQDASGDSGWNPMGHATHLFMATPLKDTDGAGVCEKNAVAKASMICVHAPGSDLKERIADIEKIQDLRCVWVSGKKMRIESFRYQDEDHSSSLTRQGKIDPRYVVLLDDIQTISCE